MDKNPPSLTILTEEDEAFRATVNRSLGYKGITCFIVKRDPLAEFQSDHERGLWEAEVVFHGEGFMAKYNDNGELCLTE